VIGISRRSADVITIKMYRVTSLNSYLVSSDTPIHTGTGL
jgi:hypothetical protein